MLRKTGKYKLKKLIRQGLKFFAITINPQLFKVRTAHSTLNLP